ncbi:TBD2A protein, partial [Picathartes gymnocephalus]|nr:TBD2A protein [Picathartes gymnocephalus]
KLCGYLNKLGIKGPIKTWKSRWFFYDENKCRLLYYRTAQDINPLGSIDLSSASFDCKMENGEGVFEIRTPSRVFTLKAISKQAMMYWLQQLQMRRWEFCNTQSRFPSNGILSCLIAFVPCFVFTFVDVVDNEDFLPLVKTPTEAVGLKAASLPAPQTSTALQNISLKHPWTEIQNTVYSICGSKQLWGSNGNVFSFDEFQEHPENVDEEQEAEEGTLEDGKMGPRLNWIRKAKWMNNGFPGSEELSREKNSVNKVSVLQQQILTLTEEVKSQKELVKLLHKALEAAQQEKRVSSMYLTAADKDRLELVRHKVRQIADLTSRLEALEQEKKELEQILTLRDSHIQELKEHVQLLMEKNHAKQEVIMTLTEQMARELSDPLQEANATTVETLYKQQEEIEHLKDDIDAYKTQNQFLNSEIHQITRLWTSVAENEKALLMKCACLQARNCQMESKYLTVLRKLQEAVPGLPNSHAELVKNLIQEALQWDVKEEEALSFELNTALCPSSEYDEYGFMTVPDYEIEDWKLLAKIQALEIKSHKLRSQEIVEKPLRDRWNSIGELNPSAELKSLIRSGIPVEHRQRVWRWMVSRHCSLVPGHYQWLLESSRSTEHPACRQIELDLPRTLTNNKHFSSPTSQLIPKLRRVLLAFSWHNPAIGYCQGLNRLAAVALLVLEDEENAFWCLVYIVENLMPADYYSDTLITSQVDQRVFKDFLSEKLPRLMAHFEQYQIDVSLITFNWFLVAFVDSLVSDILLRVWDAFLYEGTKVIFRYALAIFKYNEEEILRIHDSVEIYQYLRFFTRMITDGRKLMNIAFNDLNPFPMKLLRNRRSMHREELEAELCEFEQIKAAYVKERAEQGP